MKKDIQNFLLMVDYDLSAAKHMWRSGRYIYVIFMCHLALEKTLKAFVIIQTNKPSPKTHDLIRLLELADVVLTPAQLDFVGKINNTSVATRYPEDFPLLKSSYPKNIAKKYLDETEGLIKWLKLDKKLKQ